MARKGNPISVRLDLNRSSDSSWFSEGDRSQTINPLLGFAVFLIVLLFTLLGGKRSPTFPSPRLRPFRAPFWFRN